MFKLFRLATGASCARVGSILAAAALCFGPLPTQATIVTFTGDTTGGPTFTRPIEDLSELSVIGVNVAYDVLPFTVSVSGDYTFLTTGEFDTFTFLYGDSFDPTSSLTNALIANDDLLGLTTSGFAFTLNAGSLYVLVTTGFDPVQFGPYSTTIGGPGAITVIPESTTVGMLALGLAGVAWRRRREASARP